MAWQWSGTLPQGLPSLCFGADLPFPTYLAMVLPAIGRAAGCI